MPLTLNTFSQGNALMRADRERAPDWDTLYTLAHRRAPPEGDRRAHGDNGIAGGAPRKPVRHPERQVDAREGEIPEQNRTLLRVHPAEPPQPAQNPYGTSLLRDNENAQHLVRRSGWQSLPNAVARDLERFSAPSAKDEPIERVAARGDTFAYLEAKGDRGEAFKTRDTVGGVAEAHGVASAPTARVRVLAQPEDAPAPTAPASTAAAERLQRTGVAKVAPVVVADREQAAEKLSQLQGVDNYLSYPIAVDGRALWIIVPEVSDVDRGAALGPAFRAFERDVGIDVRGSSVVAQNHAPSGVADANSRRVARPSAIREGRQTSHEINPLHGAAGVAREDPGVTLETADRWQKRPPSGLPAARTNEHDFGKDIRAKPNLLAGMDGQKPPASNTRRVARAGIAPPGHYEAYNHAKKIANRVGAYDGPVDSSELPQSRRPDRPVEHVGAREELWLTKAAGAIPEDAKLAESAQAHLRAANVRAADPHAPAWSHPAAQRMPPKASQPEAVKTDRPPRPEPQASSMQSAPASGRSGAQLASEVEPKAPADTLRRRSGPTDAQSTDTRDHSGVTRLQGGVALGETVDAREPHRAPILPGRVYGAHEVSASAAPPAHAAPVSNHRHSIDFSEAREALSSVPPRVGAGAGGAAAPLVREIAEKFDPANTQASQGLAAPQMPQMISNKVYKGTPGQMSPSLAPEARREAPAGL